MLNPAVSNARTLPAAPGWTRLLTPSLSDLLFIALLLWLLIFTNSGAPAGLLQDAGAGVHIRTGDWILSNHAVPRVDPFSFSKPGGPWFAWEWLTDVFFALLNQVWGLKGLVLFSGAALALVCCLIVRHMVVAGANALAALVVMHAVIAAGSVHFLARPHIFTLLFLAGSFYFIDQDRRNPTKLLWLLVPLTAVWANLHGGFTGIILTLGALAAGSVLELNWRRAARYASLGAGCLGASLLNPYGYHLHEHVVEFLRAGWIRGIVLEFQPPRLDTAPGVYFEVLLFLGVAMAAKLAYEKRFAEMLAILMWAHAAMTSVRHVPIFAFLIAPYLAVELTTLMRRASDASADPKSLFGILSQLGDEHRPGLLRTSLVVPALLLALFTFSCGFTYPTDFPELKYPATALEKHADLIGHTRLYTTDAWGDYLIYRNYPQQRVFFDGRTDYYGEHLTHDYETLLNGFPGWNDVLNKYAIESVLLPPDSALGTLLKDKPEWKQVDATDSYQLLTRSPPT
ncbi:MAG TPA: hypothetical protein VGL53_25090 [Bryobacteraceae bacterium]|jgi:hypothetical protein